MSLLHLKVFLPHQHCQLHRQTKMVQDGKIIAESVPAMSNSAGHDRMSHTLVFYVNGKEVCTIVYSISYICNLQSACM